MFEDSTFESMGAIHTRASGWMMATFALNGTILLALVLIPLFYPQLLPSMVRSIPMEAPPPPLEPVPLPPVPAGSAISAPQSSEPAFQAPSVIPRVNSNPGPLDDSTPIDPGNLAGNGNPIGSRNDPFASGRNTRVIEQQPRAPAPVSQGVMNGRLLKKVTPDYPEIAKASGTQGTVVLQATISATGTIENLRVVSGPALLRQAALNAVAQWQYRPYTLNGQPVEVETTVNVVFKID
jgi:periplasmic protein TonB